MESYSRTVKLLCSIARGIPVVSSNWLIDSIYYKKAVEFDNYWLQHPNDKNLIRNAVLKAQKGPRIFEGLHFYVASEN